tara:strand:+ start:143 stop:268 length:126 start_codon:yes stop_codon:yes gene_type:complete
MFFDGDNGGVSIFYPPKMLLLGGANKGFSTLTSILAAIVSY